MGAQERWVSPGRAGHRDRRPAPSPGRPRAARLEGLARLPRSWAVRDTAPSLTCPLRQRPQEVEGCSLDADTTRQQHAEAAPHVGGGGCRAAAQLQDGHRGPEQKRLGPGRGALGLQGEGLLSTGPAGGPAGAGRRRTYHRLQKLQVRQGLAQESHAGRPGGQEGLHRHRGTRGPIRQACRANQKSLPVRGCFSIVISGLGARHQPLGHCPMSETRTGSSEQVACSGWRPAGQN